MNTQLRPFRMCEIRTIYLRQRFRNVLDTWRCYNDQRQKTWDTVIMCVRCVCTQMSVCAKGEVWGAGEWGDAGGQVNDRDELFFSQGCQNRGSAACQCHTKQRELNTFHPWPPTGHQWQACSSITKHHCSLSVTHTQRRVSWHACMCFNYMFFMCLRVSFCAV